MDSFMDKIAQKFTAQDMIKANSAAEEKEMKRLRMQIAEYDERLQEIRKLNLKNLELADQLQSLMTQGQEKVEALQLASKDAGSVEWENLEQQMQALSQALETQNTKMAELSDQIMDHVHKEDVKVYRNVQAAVAEENKTLSDSMLKEIGKKTGAVKAAVVLGAITLASSLASVGFWVCWLLGVF